PKNCAGFRHSRKLVWPGVALLVAFAAGRAQADLTAAYDGSLKVPRKSGAAMIAGALQQTNVALSGTLAVAFDDDAVSGVYWVNGQMHGAKLTLSGTNSAGVHLKWKGKMARSAVLRGVAHLTGAGKRYKGMLEQWVNLVATGHQCDAGSNVPTIALSPAELLMRASMDLRGARPALAELDAVEADPNAYPNLVEQYLHSPEFLERVKDAYDDALLVRREDFNDESRDETSAIYGEALELISY